MVYRRRAYTFISLMTEATRFALIYLIDAGFAVPTPHALLCGAFNVPSPQPPVFGMSALGAY